VESFIVCILFVVISALCFLIRFVVMFLPRFIICLRRRDTLYSDGLLAGRQMFDSRKTSDVLLLHSVHTDSRVHPASYPMGAGDFFPQG
jgi:hypothetical protein